MGRLNIGLLNEWNFQFTVETGHDRTIINNTKQVFCSYCTRTPLDKTYLYIINSLKSAGLLYRGYKPICCYCKVLTKFGLESLRDRLNSFFYSKLKNILYIRFSFYIIKSRSDGITTWDYIDFRIHDWSKIKWA